MKKPKGEYVIQTVINAMRLLEEFRAETMVRRIMAVYAKELERVGVRTAGAAGRA